MIQKFQNLHPVLGGPPIIHEEQNPRQYKTGHLSKIKSRSAVAWLTDQPDRRRIIGCTSCASSIKSVFAEISFNPVRCAHQVALIRSQDAGESGPVAGLRKPLEIDAVPG